MPILVDYYQQSSQTAIDRLTQASLSVEFIMEMTKEDLRQAAIKYMVSHAPLGKLGRTQLMKLFYFLQEEYKLDFGYDFRLFTHGPFDSEVLSDLGTACNMERVRETAVAYPKGYGFDITPIPTDDENPSIPDKNHNGMFAIMDSALQEFGHRSAAELELRSTIMFVDREFHQVHETSDVNEIARRVHGIKPHFDTSKILDRVIDMKTKNQLRSLVQSVAR